MMDKELHNSLREKLLYQETLDKVKPDVKITEIGGVQYTCNSCGAFVGYLHEYCCECGQKLDWIYEED